MQHRSAEDQAEPFIAKAFEHSVLVKTTEKHSFEPY